MVEPETTTVAEPAPMPVAKRPPTKPPKVYDFDTDGDEERNAIVRERLRAMGLTPKLTKRLLRGTRNTGEFLHRPVAGRVALIMELNTLEKVEKAQRVLNKLAHNKEVSPEERIKACAVQGQLGITMQRLSESLIKMMDRCDPTAPPISDEKKTPPVAVNVNFMPPVVSAPRRVFDAPLDEKGDPKT